MAKKSDDAGPRRSTVAQEDFEITPGEHDSSANERLSEQGVGLETLFQQSLEQMRMAVTLTDPRRDGNPIVYVNEAFVQLTGYERTDAIGRNCKFLQGPGTDPAHVEKLKKALFDRQVRVIEILNYRKDGTPFWNSLHVGPIFDSDGTLTHFYGSQWDVTDEVKRRTQLEIQRDIADELRHRTRNLFNVIGAIVRLSARDVDDPKLLARMIDERVRALGRAHEISLEDASGIGTAPLDLLKLVGAIVEPYRNPAYPNRITIDGDRYVVPPPSVTPLGLFLHELATNALKYGALSVPDGNVDVRWTIGAEHMSVTWTERGGPPVSQPEHTGSGTRIVEGIVGLIGGELTYDWARVGLTARLRLPLDWSG